MTKQYHVFKDPTDADTKFSPLAVHLWRLLTERPGRYSIGELTRDLRASKTAIGRAVTELEAARLITVEEDTNL